MQALTERLKLTIAYDGRPFAGWQSQAHGKGVQGDLENLSAALGGGKPCIHVLSESGFFIASSSRRAARTP